MNRKTTKKVDESTLTTLCAVCRGAFLDAKGVRLRRADPRQLVKDVCMYCQTRYGFDYYADMEPHIGSEQGGKRPVVVLQPSFAYIDRYNCYHPGGKEEKPAHPCAGGFQPGL